MNVGLVAGLAVAGFVILVIVAGVVAGVLYHRRTKERVPEEKEEPRSDSVANEPLSRLPEETRSPQGHTNIAMLVETNPPMRTSPYVPKKKEKKSVVEDDKTHSPIRESMTDSAYSSMKPPPQDANPPPLG